MIHAGGGDAWADEATFHAVEIDGPRVARMSWRFDIRSQYQAGSPERLIRCPAERLHAARAEVVAAG